MAHDCVKTIHLLEPREMKRIGLWRSQRHQQPQGEQCGLVNVLTSVSKIVPRFWEVKSKVLRGKVGVATGMMARAFDRKETGPAVFEYNR